MTSYRYYSNIDIEEKTAAKEKNKRLLLDILSRLKEYFYPLAAKEKKSVNNQKFLQMLHGSRGVKKEYRIMNKEHRISKESPNFDIPCSIFVIRHSIIPLAAGGKTKRRKNYGIIARYNQTQGS